MSAGSHIHCVHPISWIRVHRNRDFSGVVNRNTEYVKYTEAREREKARPHARPPTSNAKGIERMMADKKTTDEQTFRIHIGAAAEYALRRTQPDLCCRRYPGVEAPGYQYLMLRSPCTPHFVLPFEIGGNGLAILAHSQLHSYAGASHVDSECDDDPGQVLCPG